MSKGNSKQMKKKLIQKRIFLVMLAFVMIFTSGIFMDGTEAEVISQTRGPSLTQVGPINVSNGFPLWYKDSTGAKQELCLDTENGMCGLVSEGAFDAGAPIDFPTNYPGEAFYQLAEAAMESPDGKSDAIGTFALEATFNAGNPKQGDQTVFARIRLRIDSLKTDETYTIKHPYGVDVIKAENGEISYVEDIGAGQGFDGALKGRIGTFLKWDPNVAPPAPAGYVGDINQPHTVVGGVDDQNYFRIEGPGIGLVYPDFKCTPNSNDCIETDLFSLAGKIATNNGLDIQQATYSQTAQGGAIDVFVSSETGEKITVSGGGIANTILVGGNGQYFAHVPYTGTEPLADMQEIILTNTGDVPETNKKIKPVDRITATANYDTDAKQLTITAKSSDEVRPPTLTVKGLGIDQANVPESGTIVIDSSYIPPTITITSTNLGTVTIPVSINSVPDPAIANAGPDQTDIIQGTVVTLDGSKSENAVSYSWKQVGNKTISLTGENTANPTFTFPKGQLDTDGKPKSVVLELTVTGLDGKTATDTLEISAVPDNLSVTVAQYRSTDGTWRIEGKSNVFGPGVRVTITVVDSDHPEGQRLGSATVNNEGIWRFNYSNSGVDVQPGGTVTIESTSGGSINVPVQIDPILK